MTDESGTLRDTIIDAVVWHLEQQRHHNRPVDRKRLAERIAEEVQRKLESKGIQIIRMHANGNYDDD
jgi:hypothetical protein